MRRIEGTMTQTKNPRPTWTATRVSWARPLLCFSFLTIEAFFALNMSSHRSRTTVTTRTSQEPSHPGNWTADLDVKISIDPTNSTRLTAEVSITQRNPMTNPNKAVRGRSDLDAKLKAEFEKPENSVSSLWSFARADPDPTWAFDTLIRTCVDAAIREHMQNDSSEGSWNVSVDTDSCVYCTRT